MQTVLDVPPDILERVQREAARRGSSAEAVMLDAIAAGVQARQARVADNRIEVPIIHSRTPGVLPTMTNGEIDDLFDREDHPEWFAPERAANDAQPA